MFFFFFKQKTAYEMRISDWSSDVCSSDLDIDLGTRDLAHLIRIVNVVVRQRMIGRNVGDDCDVTPIVGQAFVQDGGAVVFKYGGVDHAIEQNLARSEEHTSELQSLMRISYAVFCLKKKNNRETYYYHHASTLSRSTT